MAGLSPAQAAKLARCPVIVLTANRFTSQLVRSLFFGLGMQDIAVAHSTGAALDRFELCRADLVVADTGPSTFDPLEGLRSLRDMADRRQAGIPIILLETPGIRLPAHALAALGNLHGLQKPLSSKQLRRAVLKLILNIEEEESVTQGPKAPAPRMTALLLSGNPYTAQVVRSLLPRAGLLDLAVAATPAEAERMLRSGAVDLVIADSGPVSFDGLAAVEALGGGRDGPLGEKPVLLLAANPSASLVERARAVQVRAIATKPLDPQVFAERVRKILS